MKVGEEEEGIDADGDGLRWRRRGGEEEGRGGRSGKASVGMVV